MSGARPRPRWFFLITPRWLAWHAFAVVAFIGMLWLGDWQFHRAESGNALSWAYTFEWPVFAVLGAIFWAKTIIDEFKPETAGEAAPAEIELPSGANNPVVTGRPGDAGQAGTEGSGPLAGDGDPDEADDPELAAYNAYLAMLNEQTRGHGRWHGLR